MFIRIKNISFCEEDMKISKFQTTKNVGRETVEKAGLMWMFS